MKSTLRFSLAALCAASLAACGGGVEGTRNSVRAVGSSTVYPFAKVVAENFARSNPDFGSPIIESTGTGGGIPGCESNADMDALKDSNEEQHEQLCTELRGDGAYVDQGEQDNLIVQKIEGNSNAVGVFGFSYLEENLDKVQGLSMIGVEPTYENIASFEYPGARPLFIYVKNAHVDAIPGLREFVAQWARSWGRDGPLTAIGLVANPDDVAARSQSAATGFTPLAASELK